MCKVAWIKGDADCVTLENGSFEFVGLRPVNRPATTASSNSATECAGFDGVGAGGGLASLPLPLPMITAAVEATKTELRSAILDDLRIIAEGQSRIMMNKLSMIEKRLRALETAVDRKSTRLNSSH